VVESATDDRRPGPGGLTASQEAALARVRFGIERPAGVVLLVGPAGAGKTHVLGILAAELSARGVALLHAGDDAAGARPAAPGPGRAVALADDAHDLSDGELAAVAALARSVPVVLSGRGRLLTLVDRHGRLATDSRLRAVVTPCTPDESRRLVEVRLAAAGCASPDPEALRVMHEIAAGIPGRLLRLADLVAVVAATGRRLSADDVEAIHGRLGPDAA